MFSSKALIETLTETISFLAEGFGASSLLKGQTLSGRLMKLNSRNVPCWVSTSFYRAEGETKKKKKPNKTKQRNDPSPHGPSFLPRLPHWPRGQGATQRQWVPPKDNCLPQTKKIMAFQMLMLNVIEMLVAEKIDRVDRNTLLCAGQLPPAHVILVAFCGVDILSYLF